MKLFCQKIWLYLPLLWLLLLNGCASLSERDDIQDVSAVMPVEKQAESTVFNVLAGEFSGTRGSLTAAADYYMKAARQSGDPAVADRAAHVALYATHYQDALEAIDIRLKTQAADQESYRLQAIAYLNLGNIALALPAFEQFLFPEGKVDDEAINVFEQILKRQPDDEKNLQLLTQLDQRQPGNMRLLLLLARYQVRLKQYSSAMFNIEKVLKIDPDVGAAYLLRAQIFSAQNKTDEALAAVSVALEKRPRDYRLRLQYARMLVQLKKYDDAWEEFMQLRLIRQQDSGVLLSLALLSVETGKMLLAREYFKELIDNSQHVAQAHYYLGRIEQSQKNPGEAIQHYQQVDKGEFVMDAQIRRAGLLAESGQLEQALDALRALIDQVQGQPPVQSRLYLAQGELLRKEKRIQDAMQVYNQALQQMPDDTDLLYARALTAEKLNRVDVTEADLRRVLQQDPNNANALNALGFTLADRSDRLQEAKQYILKAAELLPDDPAVLDSLGWVYYRLGQYAEAIKWLHKAFSEYKDAEIAAHLGEALWENGQNEEAQRIWQQGLKINSDNPVLQQTLKRYKQ